MKVKGSGGSPPANWKSSQQTTYLLVPTTLRGCTDPHPYGLATTPLVMEQRLIPKGMENGLAMASFKALCTSPVIASVHATGIHSASAKSRYQWLAHYGTTYTHNFETAALIAWRGQQTHSQSNRYMRPPKRDRLRRQLRAVTHW